MAMKFFREAKVSTGSYVNKNGETKKRYVRIGSLFRDDETGSMSLKLEVLPMPSIGKDGSPEVWVSFFEPYDNNKQAPQQQQNFQPQQPVQQPANSYQPQQNAPQQAFQGSNDVIPF